MEVVPAPVVLTCRHQDVDTGEFDLEVSWFSQRTWQRTTLRRDVIADHSKLPRAALSGLPVTSHSSKQLTHYLSVYENLNLDAIPRSLVTRRCGWREVDGKLGFVLGGKIIGAEAVRSRQSGTSAGELMGDDALQLLTDPGTANLAAGLQTKGTHQGWLEAMNIVSSFPRVMLGVYWALTTPLQKILEAANFILDYCGDTSLGKTTSQHAAASVWGATFGGERRGSPAGLERPPGFR